ncbi:Neuronal acetylcholine receptor subunit alpha-7 [Mizuhopecten yessoensis]|uniref:Neuronal acetylcholine receptor subunit alpha-7 n=1 Tax=Mizuhopecten yessoensis TaxID=6573 RepID=A0A210Q7T3_MIZYE|nr:Neuronal acetylcholine receptor subunit alpha-7 [Mizuhopecten yessoensis]
MKEALQPFVFLLFDFLRTINAATHTDIIRLYQNLTKDYNKKVRPTFNQSHPTKVNLCFNLLSIKELDKKTSKLSMVGMFIFSWHKFQLTWAAKDFGYMFTTTLPQNIVWKPEILLVTPYDEVEPLGFAQQLST